MKRSSNASYSATSSPTHPQQQLNHNSSNKSINFLLKTTHNKDEFNHSLNYKSAIECLTENVHLLKLSTSLSMNFFDPNNINNSNNHYSNLDKKISISSDKVSSYNQINLSYDSVAGKSLPDSTQKNDEKPFKLHSPYGRVFNVIFYFIFQF